MFLYAGPFLFLASIPAFYYCVGGCSPFATVALLLGALVAAEWLAPRGGGGDETGRSHYRMLPLIYIPLQLTVTAWALVMAANPHLFWLITVSLILSVGVTTGVFGVLAAHEMAHSDDRMHRGFALALLTAMSYRQFRIAHLYGHHRWAGTEHDSATARLGEGFYRFLLRTVRGQFLEAWRFEEKRRRARGRTLLANRLIQDVAVTLVILGAIFGGFGWRGALFFLGVSLVGIFVLELFNYIAHYGLVRGSLADGRREALGAGHSWNSSNLLANRLVFNMGRHSDHHRAPAASYESLAYVDGAPELPLGYAGSIVVALVPPLWRRVMDPEVLRLRAQMSENTRRAA